MVQRNEISDFGNIQVRVFAARGALPIDQALVVVSDSQGIEYARLYTDAGGETSLVQLPTPAMVNSLTPNLAEAYATYYITISHPAYQTLNALPVQLFTGVISILPVNLVPKSWTEVI